MSVPRLAVELALIEKRKTQTLLPLGEFEKVFHRVGRNNSPAWRSFWPGLIDLRPVET
jgi:hypothetical protein